MSVLHRTDADIQKLEDVDRDIANKWRWDWLQRTVTVDVNKTCPKLTWRKGPLTMMIKDNIQKIDLPGRAICTLCIKDDPIKYGGKGFGNIRDHLKSKKHINKVVMASENVRLPGASDAVSKDKMYGAPSSYYDTPCTSRVPPKTTVHLADRVANMEAMLVGFMAEKSLSFSLSNSIIGLAKELAKDPPALSKLRMHRTTASYKLTHGLSRTVHNELIEKLRRTPFSLNMDEATSSNTMHVFTVLVSYYNEVSRSIAVEHLGSISVPDVNSDSLFEEMKKLFEKNCLPWENLLAILADSASTMRGKIHGLETQIRDKVAPHLLDIDGDSCHHMHNIVKKFTSFFGKFLEGLYRDVSNDFKFSACSLEYLKEITFYMGLTFRKPVNFISCRWLSVYDTSVHFDYMKDVYKVLYLAIEKEELEKQLRNCGKKTKKVQEDGKEPAKKISKEELVKRKSVVLKKEAAVLDSHHLSELAQHEVLELQDQLRKKYKTATKKGKERKQRIISKLVYGPKQFTLLMSLYKTVLPLFKSYVLLFQSEKPLIHKVYYQQIDIIRTFFSYFVKPGELAKCTTGPQLLGMDLTASDLLPKDLMFIGSDATKLIKKLGTEQRDVKKFLSKTAQAYLDCGKYIQNKLPLNNKILKNFTAIDPKFVRSANSLVLKRLLELPNDVKHVIKEEEQQSYEQEVRKLLIDSQLPLDTDENGEEVECLTWWLAICKDYPIAFKMVTAILSIFHGPRVESSFSVMGDVIDQKSGRINIDTFSAIQGVKYSLHAKQPSCTERAVQEFRRKDRLYSPINPALTNNMRAAFSRYKAESEEKKEKRKKRVEEFQITKQNFITRKKANKDNLVKTEKARLHHEEVLKKAYQSPKTPSVAPSTTVAKKSSPSEEITPPLPSSSQLESTTVVCQKRGKKRQRKVQSEDSSSSSSTPTKKAKKSSPSEGITSPLPSSQQPEIMVVSQKQKKKQWKLESFFKK